jgi:hypothetical protein
VLKRLIAESRWELLCCNAILLRTTVEGKEKPERMNGKKEKPVRLFLAVDEQLRQRFVGS